MKKKKPQYWNDNNVITCHNRKFSIFHFEKSGTRKAAKATAFNVSVINCDVS